MAWNPSPKVADCRDIARKWGMQQVIILGINPSTGKYEIASYGETRAMCAEAKAINERINQIIQRQDYAGPTDEQISELKSSVTEWPNVES
jgi:hypothetical protein